LFFGSKRSRENRRLNKRIKKLQKRQARIELMGCHGDSDLKAKEEKLAAIRQEILDLNLKRESLWTGNQVQPVTQEKRNKETES